MTKLTKTTLFKTLAPRAETLLDKTTRAARAILEEETEKRQVKTARLREARLLKEAEAAKATPSQGRKMPRTKAAR